MFKSVFTFVASTLLGLGVSQAANAQTLMAVEHSTAMRSPAISSELYRSCLNGSSSLRPECYEPTAHLMIELSGMGARGDLIARTRQQTLQILNSDNRCTAWFEEIEPDVADVFGSLHYDIDANGPAEIQSIRDSLGDLYFLHPWGARAIEDSGKDAFIQLNGNGPFFIQKTHVAPSDARAAFVQIKDPQPVYIGPYVGASTEARLTIMLHELGHIVGRLPTDDDSWDRRSSANTREVLRHCKKEIREMAHQGR